MKLEFLTDETRETRSAFLDSLFSNPAAHLSARELDAVKKAPAKTPVVFLNRETFQVVVTVYAEDLQ